MKENIIGNTKYLVRVARDVERKFEQGIYPDNIPMGKEVEGRRDGLFYTSSGNYNGA